MDSSTIFKRRKFQSLILAACLLCSADKGDAAEALEADLIVYGGTSSAVIAAVQAKKMGKTAIIVCPDRHLGGLSSGGLGFTDTGNKAVVGGLSRDFYHRLWMKYQQPETWQWQTKAEYGNRGQGTPATDGANRTMWIFEPHVAEGVFEDYVSEFQIPVYRDEWLNRETGVSKVGARINSITMLSGKTFSGRVFIDATYEGDLMAAAGVSYHVGREANSVYGENWNGVQTGVLHHRNHFGVLSSKISPYVIPGDPSSGVLPRISTQPPGEYGVGDSRIQAYCYRYCATNHPENRIPFPMPEGYDPTQYELLIRIYEAGWNDTFYKFDPVPNHKTDTNNCGPFSTDNIGMNYEYPEASYERRREILDEHRRYQQGLLYFIANDPRIPQDVQERMQTWGLPKDEFVDNGHWPHQIYVREARRMIGQYVMTENELTKKKPTPDSIGMGSYTIDSHNVQRYITPDGYVQNEGDIGVSIPPYSIAYGSLVPRQEECENLMVTVCVSSSHVAFGSLRMEPVFMVLGQSAATAAVMAMDNDLSVQQVPYAGLREQLLMDGQVLEYAAGRLTVNGTNSDNVITVSQFATSGQSEKLEVLVDGVRHRFEASGITTLIVNGKSGNDTLSFSDNVRIPATLSGGDGNDIMVGGANHDVLVGGGGNDILTGGPGGDALFGGTGDDAYIFGAAAAAEADSVSESMNAGSDSLSFSTMTINIVLNTGTTSIQTVHTNRTLKLNGGTVIENVVGGSGHDILMGNSLANTLTGNSGDDVLSGAVGDDMLFGGHGRDILIGSFGVDTLHGGNDDDILIAGRTNSEKVLTRLNDLRAEWVSINSYELRVSKLRTTVGASAASLKAKVNVLNDPPAIDTLFGGGGTDWYFRALEDVITDFLPAESVDTL